MQTKIDEVLNQSKNFKTVFTNGCFDILHSGHVAYLNDAKELGEFLIVGLNSDASVKRLKGNTRPINSERERAFVLENLKAVDAVIIFEEDTPLSLIEKVSPDFLVKGGDWSIDKIIGHEFVQKSGGTVKSLPFKEGFSTTSTIDKIIKTSI